MNGTRKVVMLGMGLGTVLALAAMTAWGHLPVEALGSLTSGALGTVAAAMVGNGAEHWSRRPPSGGSNAERG